tara:strand:- start:2408 stop:2806 length:399 start_codon:yes stop_codon:yes gene_type:complete
MGKGKVHPDSVAVLFYGLGLARIDRPLGSAAGPPKFVIVSQKMSGSAPLGLHLQPTAIREDVWDAVCKNVVQLNLGNPAVLDLFKQRDTETLLNIAQRILYDAIQTCAPEYLDQIEKPAGYRIPGWDAKPQK